MNLIKQSIHEYFLNNPRIVYSKNDLPESEKSIFFGEDDSLTQQQEIELEKIEALKIAKLWGK